MSYCFRLLGVLVLSGVSVSAWAEPFSQLDRPLNFTRTRTYDLIHTRIEAEIDLKAKRIAGTSTITVAGLARARSVILFDAVDMSITKVSSTGRPGLKWDYDGKQLAVRFSKALRYKERTAIKIAFSANPKRGLHFVVPGKGRPRMKPQAWTQGEDENTRHWVPCYDYPDDVGTSETIITVKKPFKVLSNGRFLGQVEHGSKTTTHWLQKKPHVTYLIMLAIGEWKVKRTQWRGKDVSFWYRPALESKVQTTFAPTTDIMTFFSDKLKVPYPWTKYAQVAVADYMWGGMENTSATILTEDSLREKKNYDDYSSQGLVAHELAHQWFGDLLTCRGWGELWLNEGFATYFAALYREKAQGWDDFIARMYGALGWLKGEMARYERPVVTHAYDNPTDMFDGHSYSKGAWILHALRGWLNDDALWWRAMGRWVKTHRHSLVETSELRRSIEKTTGISLGQFFEQWTARAGLPKIEVSYKWDHDAKLFSVVLKQTQKTSRWVPLFVLPVDILLGDAKGKHLMKQRIWLKGRYRELVLPMKQRPEVVEIDPRGWIPGTVQIHWSKKGALAALNYGSTVVTRYRAARHVKKYVGEGTLAAKLAPIAKTERWWVAARIAKTLGVLNTDEALDGLIALTRHPHTRARAAAARALGNYEGSKKASKALTALLRDPSLRVVASAAKTTWRLGFTQSVGRLAKLVGVRSPYEDVASGALTSLAQLGVGRAWKLAKGAAASSANRFLRAAGYRTLGRIALLNPKKRTDAIKLLQRGLMDGQPRVRRAVLDGLALAGGKEVLSILRKTVMRERDTRTRRHCGRILRSLAREIEGTKDSKKLGRKVDGLASQNKRLKRRIQGLEKRLKLLRTHDLHRH